MAPAFPVSPLRAVLKPMGRLSVNVPFPDRYVTGMMSNPAPLVSGPVIWKIWKSARLAGSKMRTTSPVLRLSRKPST
jgi:hypothetical protein